ncbi:hypothetical protein [Clostridium thailandense]|uniref:hypothetical protein n=1 Tax=Clostridium thailandense TaxID=2794346 RepID=UPI0039898950
MTRDEALKHFDENYVQVKSIEKFKCIEEYYLANKEKIINSFIESFTQICLKIKDYQLKGEKEGIGYIQYSMLRTNIMEKKYEYVVHAFDTYWYFDEENCSVEYDVKWIFKFLDELEDELEEKRVLYMNKITKADIDKIKLSQLEVYNKILAAVAKYAIPRAIRLKEFEDILLDEVLEVRFGEYRGTSEVIYKEDKHKKENVS